MNGPIVEIKRVGLGRVFFEEAFLSKYAMVLRFGQTKRGLQPGTIYVCFPDEKKSFVAGSFEATIASP